MKQIQEGMIYMSVSVYVCLAYVRMDESFIWYFSYGPPVSIGADFECESDFKC